MIIYFEPGIQASASFSSGYRSNPGSIPQSNNWFSRFMIPVDISSTFLWDHSYDSHRFRHFSFHFTFKNVCWQTIKKWFKPWVVSTLASQLGWSREYNEFCSVTCNIYFTYQKCFLQSNSSMTKFIPDMVLWCITSITFTPTTRDHKSQALSLPVCYTYFLLT